MTAKTEFAGRQILNGGSGFRATGVDTSTILDVDVVDKQTGDAVTVAIEVTSTATQATNSYTDGSVSGDTTLIVTGPDGTTTISLSNGDNTQTITDAFNAVTYLTGVTATRISGSDIDFTTADYGSAASVTIEVTTGDTNLDSSGTITGTDATATINGQSVTGDGSTFNFNSSNLSLVVEVDPTASGTLNSFTVSGEGLNFVIGSSPTNTARIGLPNLTTSSLGGVTGKLSSIISGGANSLTGGNSTEALRIVDDAIGDATRSQAIIGGFQKFTLDSAENVLSSKMENLSSALSAIQDTDIALESALLANNRLRQESTLQVMAIINLQNQSVLNLLAKSTLF